MAYTYRLQRDADGQLRQTNIRGNHVAVVVRGRAGKEIAIGDSSPFAANDTKSPLEFFAGKPYSKGVADWNAYIVNRKSRGAVGHDHDSIPDPTAIRLY